MRKICVYICPVARACIGRTSSSNFFSLSLVSANASFSALISPSWYYEQYLAPLLSLKCNVFVIVIIDNITLLVQSTTFGAVISLSYLLPCVCLCASVHACVRACLHPCMRGCLLMCTRACMCACVRVRAHTCGPAQL